MIKAKVRYVKSCVVVGIAEASNLEDLEDGFWEKSYDTEVEYYFNMPEDIEILEILK